MDTQIETTNPAFVFHRIPTEVSRKDFNRYIDLPFEKTHKRAKAQTLALQNL